MYTLNPDKQYSRIGGVVYLDGVPLVKMLRGHWIDLMPMSSQAIRYMNEYFKFNPELIEVLDDIF